MSDCNILSAAMRAVDAQGVPRVARAVSIESAPHDDQPGRAMVVIEFDTGHLVGAEHHAVLTEAEQWALAALLAMRRVCAQLAEEYAA